MPINLNISSLGTKFIDLRGSIPGDSFNWSWIRPLSQVNYLAIHHTAGPDTQTPNEIANYHINNNGWGGVGYHFLISKDGTVYYVGDLSTARANVANLNEQVIGICLIGNFTSGRVPTEEQFDSAHKLCDFFINNYPDLTNLNSWEVVRGHKELPGQSTTCPGDNWPNWRGQIVSGLNISSGGIVFNPTSSPQPVSDRGAQITEAYRSILGRDPDMGGLQAYTNGSMSVAEIMVAMIHSDEHRDLIRAAKDAQGLQSQINSLQTTLASVNQQVIFLQEAVSEKDQQVNDLKKQVLVNSSQPQPTPAPDTQPKVDTTVTLIGALMNLYKFIFAARSNE